MSQNEVSVWGSYGSLNDKMFLISAFSFFKVIRKSGRVVKIFKLLGCYYMVKDFIDFNVCFFHLLPSAVEVVVVSKMI